MKTLIIILGMVGSGKDTQADILAKKLNLNTLSMGQLLRDEVSNGSRIGQEIAPIIKAGKLLKATIVMKVLKHKLNTIKLEKGIILNGVPRNPAQIRSFEKLRKELGLNNIILFNLTISTKVAKQRIAKRGSKGNRTDLSPQALKSRISWSNAKTKKVVNYYRNMNVVHDINAELSIDSIANKIFNIYSKNKDSIDEK